MAKNSLIYVRVGSRVIGPQSIQEINHALRQRTIAETDFAWIDGTREELPLVDLLALLGQR